MDKIGNEVKVGALVLVGIAIFLYLGYRTGDLIFKRAAFYDLSAEFATASGLDLGDAVQVAGVEIGEVSSIDLINGRAMVGLKLRADVPVRADAVAAIKSYGLLGDRYIEISAGTEERETIEPGGKIRSRASTEAIDVLMGTLGEVAVDVKAVTENLSRVFGGDEGEGALRDILMNMHAMSEDLRETISKNNERFDLIIENMALLSGDLSLMVADNREAITSTIASLPEASKDLKITIEDMRLIIHENRDKISETIVSLRNASARLDGSLTNIEAISRKISEGDGTIGMLVNDDTVYEDLRVAIGELKGTIEDMREQAPLSAFISAIGVAF